jgi:succinate dehydrogenase / fumarate reductase cytochrome b subunit
MSCPTASKMKRPLSPHLQVYKPQLTSITSILHRVTGAALAVGTLMLAWWLIAAAMGEDAYNVVRAFTASPLGTFMLFGWSAALYYHLFNGIRHLIWDSVHLFKLKDAYAAGYLVLLLTVIFTGATWYCAYHF